MFENKEIDPVLDGFLASDGVVNLPAIPSIEADEDFIYSGPLDMGELPLLALRNVVLFPGQTIPVTVGRERSARLIRTVERTGGVFGTIAQRDVEVDDPLGDDLYPVGTLAVLDGVVELPSGKLGVTIRGLQRFRLLGIVREDPYLTGMVEILQEEKPRRQDVEFRALANSLKENFFKVLKLQDQKIPRAYTDKLQGIRNVPFLINFSVAALSVNLIAKQQLLEMDSLRERGLRVLSYQQSELQMLRLKRNLTDRTQKEMDKQQREYFLQQQIRTFQEELGAGSGGDSEISDLREQGKGKHWTTEVAEAFEKELRKAERLNPQSPDYAVQMQYLRTILALPWGEYTEDNFDLKAAQKRLDNEHYGLEKVKERILEHLAVLKLKGDMKSPIICLYGPPGVGKTSLGRSIADSLGRRYVRISLGGVHDEAEIRGHRRTYIGAMSGRIIQSLQKAGSSNPVFVLDEIDKIGASHRGDPSSALLEVLDPEQNTTFHDNYLDIDYDLSQVLFIATANSIGEISQPLRDRMEMIEVSGYITEEKIQIARKHLIPKAAEDHGLSDKKIKFTPKAIETIIESYTRESGVRALSKAIASIMRKVAWHVASEGDVKTEITPRLVKEYLGKPLHIRDIYEGNEHPGVVVGLAWTSVGGEILFVETSLHRGTEFKITLTGSLGDVMKESAVLALDYVRAHREVLGISEEAIKEREIHVHVPEGAVPKDGPSAGITIVTSMVSAMTRRRVRAGIAMTGEMTLRGKVLPVGGIKEKILAAKRSGITDIILCRDNERDIEEINGIYLRGLTFHYVEDIRQVLSIALTDEVIA